MFVGLFNEIWLKNSGIENPEIMQRLRNVREKYFDTSDPTGRSKNPLGRLLKLLEEEFGKPKFWRSLPEGYVMNRKYSKTEIA
ncbi:hypothetical protein KJ780_04070 [Candidatus Micrarchaeota archaeon]|nr:hypothetical protein [Candidatus Micrarchaeota archaeon]